MRAKAILLVDDDERLLRAAGKVLEAGGFQVVRASSGREALAALKVHPVGLAICDLRLPDIDGISLLQQMRGLRSDIEVVMVTGHGTVEKAVEAMRLGAYDFIEKPLESTGLLKVVAKAFERQGLSRENKRLRRELDQDRGPEALVGGSPAMRAVKALIRQVASTDVNVLIQGESGTGKELVANALHHLSGRSEGPLVKISCAAIPETLLESELFGYERGAFTGAVNAKPGKFELADGGTLLLDEIAEMSPALQAKLLRVLQDGRFQRLGGARELRSDGRSRREAWLRKTDSFAARGHNIGRSEPASHPGHRRSLRRKQASGGADAGNSAANDVPPFRRTQSICRWESGAHRWAIRGGGRLRIVNKRPWDWRVMVNECETMRAVCANCPEALNSVHPVPLLDANEHIKRTRWAQVWAPHAA